MEIGRKSFNPNEKTTENTRGNEVEVKFNEDEEDDDEINRINAELE